MNWTPRQVDDTSLWQLAVCYAAWRRFQGQDDEVVPLSPEEYDRDLREAAERRARLH